MSSLSLRERLVALSRLPEHPGYHFYFGSTVPSASTIDQRFSYFLHIPKAHSWSGPKLPLVVVIHGTSRNAQTLRDSYSEFAEKNACAILVPFFPAGILHRDDLDSYKGLTYHDIRFDKILLAMIDEVAEVYAVETAKFLLAGYSGGGQFAQRFFYLHPRRFRAVSIGAPGKITLPDSTLDWPEGFKDLGVVFGVEHEAGPDFGAMADVAVQFLVGEQDNHPSAIGASDGTGRRDRIVFLQEALADKEVGVGTPLDVVPGLGHSGVGARDPVQVFLAKHLP